VFSGFHHDVGES